MFGMLSYNIDMKCYWGKSIFVGVSHSKHHYILTRSLFVDCLLIFWYFW